MKAFYRLILDMDDPYYKKWPIAYSIVRYRSVRSIGADEWRWHHGAYHQTLMGLLKPYKEYYEASHSGE